MKLELKHLDFSNNGEVRLTRLPHWDFENVKLQDCELGFNGVTKEPFLRYKDVTFGLDQIKLYKRSLHQLTEEIEHNGERFVPINFILPEICENSYPAKIRFQDTCWLKENKNDAILSLSYKKVQKLYEWHFAVNIPQELYIEKTNF